MLREIFLIGSVSTTMLCAMGGPVPNYDEKFNEHINNRINERIKENLSSKENIVEEEIVEEVIPKENYSSDISNIRLKSLVFQEIKGKNVPVKEVKRGTKVVYINVVVNDSSKTKRDIVIKNPIPMGTEYVLGSATCNNGCIISYSNDGGLNLSSSEQGNVSFIEYYFKSMMAGKEYRMGFRAMVK